MCVIKIIVTHFFPQFFRHLVCVDMLRKSQKVSVCICWSLDIFENLLLKGFRSAALCFSLHCVNFSAVMFIPLTANCNVVERVSVFL